MVGDVPDTLRYGSVPSASRYPGAVDWDAAGNNTILRTLERGAPCLIARLGLSEVWCASFWRRWRRLPLRPNYPAYARELMNVNAGYFPADEEALDRFSQRLTEDCRQADVMAVWFNRGEDAIVRRYCPSAQLVELGALNSMCYPQPWSSYLKDRRVLVVHPFVDTIQRQYAERRHLLFVDESVLPRFELITMRAVQSVANTPCGFASWFDALEYMCDAMTSMDFDVAIIGAGAYGLPLGAFAKRLGRQAVHMGGSTQLLFGVIGRRWEVEYAETIVPLVNEHWCRPSQEERPANATDVEDACYW